MFGMRIWILVILCVGLAAFSVFGWLAASEPGTNPVWKTIYTVTFAAAVVGAYRAVTSRSRTPPRGP